MKKYCLAAAALLSDRRARFRLSASCSWQSTSVHQHPLRERQ